MNIRVDESDLTMREAEMLIGKTIVAVYATRGRIDLTLSDGSSFVACAISDSFFEGCSLSCEVQE